MWPYKQYLQTVTELRNQDPNAPIPVYLPEQPQNTKPQQIPDRINILVSKSVPNSSLISGVVEVCMNKTHSGLFIQLSGKLKLPPNKEIDLILRRPNSIESPTFVRICGGKKAFVKVNPFLLTKYGFQLAFPEKLPLSIDSSLLSVEYKLSLVMRKYGEFIVLKERVISYPGKLSISPILHFKSLVEKEVAVDGVQVTLSLPRDEFLLGESIPFTLKLLDSLRTGVKKVVVSLKMSTTLENEGQVEPSMETQILVNATFKRFLKREICLRNGKMAGKPKLPSYSSNGNFGDGHKFRIGYDVEIQIVTFDLKNAVGSIPITFGTIYANSMPPSAPILERRVSSTEILPTAPPALSRRSSLPFLFRSSSLLSLFPPSYSALGSRRASLASLVSIETLPPHYDDVVEEEESRND